MAIKEVSETGVTQAWVRLSQNSYSRNYQANRYTHKFKTSYHYGRDNLGGGLCLACDTYWNNYCWNYCFNDKALTIKDLAEINNASNKKVYKYLQKICLKSDSK